MDRHIWSCAHKRWFERYYSEFYHCWTRYHSAGTLIFTLGNVFSFCLLFDVGIISLVVIVLCYVSSLILQALSWTFYRLCLNPDCQEKARKEILTVLTRKMGTFSGTLLSLLLFVIVIVVVIVVLICYC